MVFKFSNPLLSMLLPALSLYGCMSRLDLAPVVTDQQRNSQYRWATLVPGPNMEGNTQSVPLIEQSIAGDTQIDVKNNSHPLGSGQARYNHESGLSPADPKYVKPIPESTLSAGVKAGRDEQKPGRASQMALPSQIATGPTKPALAAYREDQAENKKSKTNLKAAGATKDSHGESVSSRPTKSRVGKQTFSKLSKTDYNSQEKKKKSIGSIDNKNILMLNFQWPLKGNVRKQFYQTERKGIDIAGKTGQAVRASEAGKVVYSGQGLIGFGNLLIIKHGHEYLSAYANNGDLMVKEGQRVGKGQNIAKLGAAVSKKAILHFEIRKNGKPVDPLSLLP